MNEKELQEKIKILEETVQALKDLNTIKDQTIQALQAKPPVTITVPQYIPWYPSYPYWQYPYHQWPYQPYYGGAGGGGYTLIGGGASGTIQFGSGGTSGGGSSGIATFTGAVGQGCTAVGSTGLATSLQGQPTAGQGSNQSGSVFGINTSNHCVSQWGHSTCQ